MAYAENFHGGGFIQWHMVSFVFGARCSWRHNLTSESCFQTNVLAKFVDIMCICFYMHFPYFMCHCTKYTTIQTLALQPAVWGISCLVLLPSPCNDSACTYHSALFVKPQQWPTPSELIAIYCGRKLVSCTAGCKARAWIVAFDKRRIPAAGASTEVKWTPIKKLWETRNNLRIVAWNFYHEKTE